MTLGQLKRLVTESAEEVPPSKLDGMSNQQARKTIMRIYLKNTKHDGFFRDDAWQAVHKIMQTFSDLGLNFSYGPMNDREHSGGYYRNDRGYIAGKQWEWSVTFVNNRDRETEIRGTLITSFGGTVDQMENNYLGPDRPYDICFYTY